MSAAAAALLRSSHWRRHGGRDHFFSTSSFNHPAPLSTRMMPLSKVLRCSIAGRYKGFRFGYKRSARSSVGICAIEMPYVGPRQAAMAARARRALARPGTENGDMPHNRSTLLYFAGSLDVCCYGQAARCAVGRLKLAAQSDPTVLIRPQMPLKPELAGPCLRSVLDSLGFRRVEMRASPTGSTSARQLSASTWPRHEPVASSNKGVAPEVAYGHNALLTRSMLDLSERDMASSLWCLVPAGDSALTDRLYSAIASGCLPIVIADELRGAFPTHARYEDFWLRVTMKDFVRHPEKLLHQLRAIPKHEVLRGRRMLRTRIQACSNHVCVPQHARRAPMHMYRCFVGRKPCPTTPETCFTTLMGVASPLTSYKRPQPDACRFSST